MACGKGCVSNREQTLLEGVFNIWLPKPHSLEACSNFITFPGFHFHICPNLCIFFFTIFSSSVQPFFLPFPSAWPTGCFTQPVFLKSLDWGVPMRQQLISVSVILLSSIESYSKSWERDINDKCRLITQESVENCIKMAQQ